MGLHHTSLQPPGPPGLRPLPALLHCDLAARRAFGQRSIARRPPQPLLSGAEFWRRAAAAGGRWEHFCRLSTALSGSGLRSLVLYKYYKLGFCRNKQGFIMNSETRPCFKRGSEGWQCELQGSCCAFTTDGLSCVSRLCWHLAEHRALYGHRGDTAGTGLGSSDGRRHLVSVRCRRGKSLWPPPNSGDDASLLGRMGQKLAKEIPGAGTVPAAARAALGSGQSPLRRAQQVAAGLPAAVAAAPAANPCGGNGLLH